MSEVQRRLKALLKRNDAPTSRQLNVRLDWETWILLDAMSQELDLPPSTIGGELLEGAIADAARALDLQIHQVGEDEFFVAHADGSAPGEKRVEAEVAS
ncbi:MAG TPA: hypothetical protein VHS28_01465 [Chloroflexota bacterium]|nr:hypothetical protein [Chloroflexota bacterium]